MVPPTATPSALPAARRHRVLESYRQPRATTNPYLTQLGRALGEYVDVLTFSWRTALTGRYELFHVHWPEVLMRSAGRWPTWRRRVLFGVLLLRLRVRRVPVVRTVHNLAPHESPSRIERVLLRALDRQVVAWIALRPGPPPVGLAPVYVIEHGHYRDWFAGRPHPDPVAGRVLFFGLVRAYKGVPELLSAFVALEDPAASLRVVGSCSDVRLAESVVAAGLNDARVSADLSYLDDDRLATEIGQAQLVVLPYRQLYNSGAVLLALSLDRPVLVPDNPAMTDLAQEVGPGWVFTFTGEFTAAELGRALAAAQQPPAERPRLSGREWPDLARRHADVFDAVLRQSPRPRR